MHYILESPKLIQKAKNASANGSARIQDLARKLGISDIRITLIGNKNFHPEKIYIPQNETPAIPGFEITSNSHTEGNILFYEWSPKQGIQGQEAIEFLKRFAFPNPANIIFENTGIELQENTNALCTFVSNPENPEQEQAIIQIKGDTLAEEIESLQHPEIIPAWKSGMPEGATSLKEAWEKADSLLEKTEEEHNPFYKIMAADLWGKLTTEGEGEDMIQTLMAGGHPSLCHERNTHLKKHLIQKGWVLVEENNHLFELVR